MRLLLDTHAWLWWYEGTELNEAAVDVIGDPANEVHVSAVSIWEASIKQAIGKLRLDDLTTLIDSTDEDFTRAVVDFEHARLAGQLPLHHRDPFDRMLVAQATLDGLMLVTRDRWVSAYQVATYQV